MAEIKALVLFAAFVLMIFICFVNFCQLGWLSYLKKVDGVNRKICRLIMQRKCVKRNHMLGVRSLIDEPTS